MLKNSQKVTVGTFIKGWLETNERSAAWLAKKAHVHQSQMSKVISGDRSFGIKPLRRIEQVMQLQAGTLLLVASDGEIPTPTAVLKKRAS